MKFLQDIPKFIYMVAEKDVIRIERVPNNEMKFIVEYHKLPKGAEEETRKIFNLKNIHFCFMVCQTIKKGVKILRPSILDFELLEMTDLNIKIEDYAQPFETIVLDLPKDYVKSRTINEVSPEHVIINYQKELKMILVTLVGYSNNFPEPVVSGISITQDQDIEEQLERIKSYNEKQDNYYDIVRAALNACLIMDEYGVKCIGPENPNYYNKLVELIKKASKRTAEIYKRNRNKHPIVYEFNSEVILVKQEIIGAASQCTSSGRVVAPHHRRGYYRMQVHGPANSLRKRIRVAPVFVNAHLFVGNIMESTRTYKV